MLGLGLSLGLAPIQGDGYASQRAALRSFIASNGSLVPGTAAASPTITLGTTSPTLTGTTIAKDHVAIRYIGGGVVEGTASIQPGTYPANRVLTAKNLSFSSVERTVIGAIVEFDITCPKFEIYEYCQQIPVRVLVNNEVSGSYTQTNTSDLKYRLFDFSAINAAPVQRKIRLEFGRNANFGGIKLDTNGELLSLQDTVDYSICWLGDSFTEGAGATTTHAAVAPYCSKLLGFRDYWMSAFGGTGYNQSWFPGYGSTRPSLADRVGWDGVGADVYVVAMGINDSNTGLSAKVSQTLDTLRANNPTSLIIVLGAWGNGSGVSYNTSVESTIGAACAGRRGVKYISVYDITFTKADATHPNASGHVTLGTAVANRIKTWLGIA